jgi:hypothetical protein
LVGERVVFRHAADRSATGAAEAAGAAALLWLCLEEPASVAELEADLAAAGPELDVQVDDVLAVLLDHALIEVVEPTP